MLSVEKNKEEFKQALRLPNEEKEAYEKRVGEAREAWNRMMTERSQQEGPSSVVEGDPNNNPSGIQRSIVEILRSQNVGQDVIRQISNIIGQSPGGGIPTQQQQLQQQPHQQMQMQEQLSYPIVANRYQLQAYRHTNLSYGTPPFTPYARTAGQYPGHGMGQAGFGYGYGMQQPVNPAFYLPGYHQPYPGHQGQPVSGNINPQQTHGAPAHAPAFPVAVSGIGGFGGVSGVNILGAAGGNGGGSGGVGGAGGGGVGLAGGAPVPVQAGGQAASSMKLLSSLDMVKHVPMLDSKISFEMWTVQWKSFCTETAIAEVVFEKPKHLFLPMSQAEAVAWQNEGRCTFDPNGSAQDKADHDIELQKSRSAYFCLSRAIMHDPAASIVLTVPDPNAFAAWYQLCQVKIPQTQQEYNAKRSEWASLKQGAMEKFDDYATRAMKIFHSFSLLGRPLDQSEAAFDFLARCNSLSAGQKALVRENVDALSSLQAVIAATKGAIANFEMDSDVIPSKLKEKGMRTESGFSTALAVESSSTGSTQKSGVCHNCGQSGHWKRDCPMPMKSNKGKSGFKKNSNMSCTGCGKKGHTVERCWSKNKKDESSSSSKPAAEKASANAVSGQDNTGEVYMGESYATVVLDEYESPERQF